MAIIRWNCHVFNSDLYPCKYDMIVGRKLMSELGMDLKFSTNEIICLTGPLNGTSAAMIPDKIPFKNNNLKEITVIPTNENNNNKNPF